MTVKGDQRSEGRSESPWTNIILLSCLMINAVSSVLRSRGNMATLIFTLCMYTFLITFFCCLHLFEQLPRESKRREKLKVLIWILATIVNLMFGYRVWTIVRPSVVLESLVWGVVGSTSALTFYFFFVCPDTKTKSRELDAVCNA